MPDRLSCKLSLPCPYGESERVTLMGVRRMAAHGLHDAHAAAMFFGRIGGPFRRPLTLLRALMVDIASISERRITLAPCCALRMTLDEGLMLEAIAFAAPAPLRASDRLEQLLNSRAVSTPLTTAIAYANAWADIGQPFTPIDYSTAARNA